VGVWKWRLGGLGEFIFVFLLLAQRPTNINTPSFLAFSTESRLRFVRIGYRLMPGSMRRNRLFVWFIIFQASFFCVVVYYSISYSLFRTESEITLPVDFENSRWHPDVFVPSSACVDKKIDIDDVFTDDAAFDVVKATKYYQYTLVAREGDHIAEYMHLHGYWASMTFLHSFFTGSKNGNRHVKPILDMKSDYVFDIGCNIGSVSAAWASVGWHSFCFEPHPANIRAVQRARLLNQFQDRIYLFPYGLGRKAEELRIITRKRNPSNGIMVTSKTHDMHKKTKIKLNEGIQVKVMKLDVLVQKIQNERLMGLTSLQQVKFVKIDVEGFEKYVFEGGLEFFKAVHPVILSEFCGMFTRLQDPPQAYSSPAAVLKEIGYRLFWIIDAKEYPKKGFRLKEVDLAYIDKNCGPDYGEEILYVHEEDTKVLKYVRRKYYL